MSAPTGSELVEQLLARSRTQGCVVIVSEATEANLRWANNTLTTNGFTRHRRVSVIAVQDGKVGVRSASTADAEALADLLRAAEADAAAAPVADDAAPLISGGADADFGEGAEETSIGVFSEIANDLGETFGRARADALRMFGFATHDITTTWLGSSTGLRRRHVQPTGYIEVTAKNDRPGGSSWWGKPSRDMSDLSVPLIDEELRRRLSWTERSVDLPAGRYDTVLPPSAVADLLVYAYWSSAGRDAAEGRSAYSRPGGQTRRGDAIGSPDMQLWSDPSAPGLAVEPFVTTTSSSSMSSIFDNGMTTGRSTWLADGHLTALVETRATAARADLAVTSYVDNLLLDAGGSGTTDDVVSSVERGLLLTCLWYVREVDPETLLLTGLTRDGVYLIENGEVTGVVNNFRFNESPIDLLSRVTQSSAPEICLPREWSDDFRWTSMPALRIPDFRMSSVSPAT